MAIVKTSSDINSNIFGTVWAVGEAEELGRWLKFCSDLVELGIPYNKIPAIVRAVKNV